MTGASADVINMGRRAWVRRCDVDAVGWWLKLKLKLKLRQGDAKTGKTTLRINIPSP